MAGSLIVVVPGSRIEDIKQDKYTYRICGWRVG